MADYLPQPDSGGNCCDCPARTSPCDNCSHCVFVQTVDLFCGQCFNGFGNVVGDIFTAFSQVDGFACVLGMAPFQLHVDSVDGDGAVTSVTIIPGVGWNPEPSSGLVSLNGGSGIGIIVVAETVA